MTDIWYFSHYEKEGVVQGKPWLTNGQTLALFKINCDENNAIAEIEASRIAKELSIPCAYTELYEWEGHQGILSHNFKKPSIIYRTADDICSEIMGDTYVHGWDNLSIDIVRDKWPQLQKGMVDMLFFDCLIQNDDRHGKNFEVEVSEDDKLIKLAPLFDHGMSMNEFPSDICRVGWSRNWDGLSHFEMFERLLQYYPEQIKRLLDRVSEIEINSFCSLRYKEMLAIL